MAFALLAHRMRGVTISGAIAGAISCFVLYLGGGPALCGADHGFRARLDHHPAGLPAQAEAWGQRNAGTAARGPRFWPIWGWRLPVRRLRCVGSHRPALPAGDGCSALRSCRRYDLERSRPGLRKDGPPGYYLESGYAGNRWRCEPGRDLGGSTCCRISKLRLFSRRIAASPLAANLRGFRPS